MSIVELHDMRLLGPVITLTKKLKYKSRLLLIDIPRSRDHLFSHSMSKAGLPHGADMRYLTFNENTVP